LVLLEAVTGALGPGNQAKMQKKLVALFFSIFVYVSFFIKENANKITKSVIINQRILTYSNTFTILSPKDSFPLILKGIKLWGGEVIFCEYKFT